MNVIPQYKVTGTGLYIILIHNPVNYDRIIHNKNNYAKRQDIGQTSGKINLILKLKICVIR